MKRVGIMAIILLLVCSYSFIAYAAEGVKSAQTLSLQDSRKQIGQKAERGLEKALFGWTEIPKRIVDITKESRNPFWGLIAGVYQGTCKAFAKTASGVVDVATCGIKSNEKPFIQPDMDVK